MLRFTTPASLLETLALLALAWWGERYTEALGMLTEALQLAAPGGLVRVFVDSRPRLLRPLELLAARNVTPAFTAQIVAALLRDILPQRLNPPPQRRHCGGLCRQIRAACSGR